MAFDSISSNIDEALSINPSPNMFFFGDFSVHHKDWLTCSGGTDTRPDELCYNSCISINDLTQIVITLAQIPDCDSHSLALLDYFYLLTPLFVLQWLSYLWETLIMLLSQFQLTFP